MKILIIATCLFIPLYAGSIHKRNTSDEVNETNFILEEQPPEIYTTITAEVDIDVNDYRGPLQNLKSNIPENTTLKKKFNGISYEILTSTDNGPRYYATLEFDDAVEACKKLQPGPQTLLTFNSANENAFITKWLFRELKIVTQVWIGLVRVNATNDFIWADGTTLTTKNEKKRFKNWHKCEPNDITTTNWGVNDWGENCVEMYSSYYPYPLRCDVDAKAGQWNDIPCRQIYNMVVCQSIDPTYKSDPMAEVEESNDTEEDPVEEVTVVMHHIDVNTSYRDWLLHPQIGIPENAILKKEFNEISYEILLYTGVGPRDYLTLEYDKAVETCKRSQPEPRTLLTFNSEKENTFVANWLFDELKIENKVWISLTRVNGTNDFIWADGTTLTTKNEKKLFKNWHKCEPNDITTTNWGVDDWGENCVEMYSSSYPYPLRCDEPAKTGQWNDIPCTQIYNLVVCQGKTV